MDQVKARYPGLEAGVTGPDALEADEMSSSMQDITLATWLSLAGQLGLLILFLRSLRRTLVEGLVLVLGMCWTFGLVTLVVGHLNLLSMIFAPSCWASPSTTASTGFAAWKKSKARHAIAAPRC